MPTSTIPQLQEVTEPTDEYVLPVDSDVQTYKLQLQNLFAYMLAKLNPGQITEAMLAAGAVSYGKIPNATALSVLGNATDAAATLADITAGTDHYVLRRSGTALGFGLLTNDNLDAAAAIAGTKVDAATASVRGTVKSGGIYYDTYTTGSSAVNTSDVDLDSWTITASGIYLVTAYATFSNADTDTAAVRAVELQLLNNGSEVCRGITTVPASVASGAEYAQISVSRVLTLTATQVLKTRRTCTTAGGTCVVSRHGMTVIPLPVV